ncbi:MAG: diaminopimelate decarboxylase, partial [Dehalococcoidia bacterium]|nr:diaminopimelate decarboxylase [Dehalococcoidia bacterium]
MNFSNIDVFPMGTKINSAGVLEIGGCDMVALAKAHGTPLYVYDEKTIRSMAQTFVGEFTSR